ncbi:MAG: plasmid stabilization protein [Acidobacteria bacterium]|nr:plasmid stabilization protein [Acidobacteriota bacterium]
MASITIRNLSPESKAKLRRRAEQRGCSLEALARSILDQAAEDTSVATGFPDDLIALVEPGDDIEPFLREHRQPQEPIDLS